MNNLLEDTDTVLSETSDPPTHGDAMANTDVLDRLDSASLLSNEMAEDFGVGQLRPGWLFLRQCIAMKAGRWVLVGTVLLCVFLGLLNLLVVYTNGMISWDTWWPVPVLFLAAVVTVFLLITIVAHKQTTMKTTLKVST